MSERAAPSSLTPTEVSRLLATLPNDSATGVVKPDVTLRFQEYWRATQSGSSFVEALRGRPAFGNPYLLAEVIATFQIEDTPEHGVPNTDFYDVLAQGMRTTATDGDGGGGGGGTSSGSAVGKGVGGGATTRDDVLPPPAVLAPTSSDAPTVVTKKSRWQ